ncbi:MAG: bifunctional histidinol-phosphatase/imidazoleglycerol-phosphate dehydratase HisB [Xanthomonadales bacterium]|nr:bifunctional histidinol-phosphatase/imidazoleglycerol-phosphate dehydratase HisB [Xanthomonadales bacterium]
MSKRKILFVDRDGTLIEEPEDEQIDRFEKLALVDGVIPAMLRLKAIGYEFVMVSNQDGLGTDSFPEDEFEGPHRLVRQIFSSQGIEFADELIDRSFPEDNAFTRKPRIGLVLDYLKGGDLDLQASAVIGDRETDIELAENMGIRGFLLKPDGLDWPAIADVLENRPRHAVVRRETKETRIEVEVDLDRTAEPEISTGIGFFDHMLDQLGKHGSFALRLTCDGDLEIDEHHTVEDSALALGEALRRALDDKRGIGRYGFVLPMDETQAQVAIDLGGRSYLRFEGEFPVERVGQLSTEMVPHFFRSLADALGATIHIRVDGENSHHMVEAVFKGVARCLRQAVQKEGGELPSTKGMLA